MIHPHSSTNQRSRCYRYVSPTYRRSRSGGQTSRSCKPRNECVRRCSNHCSRGCRGTDLLKSSRNNSMRLYSCGRSNSCTHSQHRHGYDSHSRCWRIQPLPIHLRERRADRRYRHCQTVCSNQWHTDLYQYGYSRNQDRNCCHCIRPLLLKNP